MQTVSKWNECISTKLQQCGTLPMAYKKKDECAYRIGADRGSRSLGADSLESFV